MLCAVLTEVEKRLGMNDAREAVSATYGLILGRLEVLHGVVWVYRV